MDSTTLIQLRSICELLETLKPLLQENISRLQQEVSQQEPLIQRLLEPEITAQETFDTPDTRIGATSTIHIIFETNTAGKFERPTYCHDAKW